MDLKKNKISQSDQMEIFKLVIDKLLIGVLIIIFGFAANYAIERYRARSMKDRFLLERRLAAVEQVNQAYFKMHNELMNTMQIDQLNPGHYGKLKNFLGDFNDTWINNNILISVEFANNMENISWLYASLFRKDLSNMRIYRVFFYDVYSKFNYLTRQELGFSQEQPEPGISLSIWTKEKADLVGEDKYLDENFEQWELSNQAEE